MKEDFETGLRPYTFTQYYVQLWQHCVTSHHTSNVNVNVNVTVIYGIVMWYVMYCNVKCVLSVLRS